MPDPTANAVLDREPDAGDAPPSLLRVEDVVVSFDTDGGTISPVAGVSIEIHQGETLGLVGESGCGKSTLGRAIVGLVDVASGSVHFDGRDLSTLSPKELRRVHRDLQIVFQDPRGSLDPRMRIGQIVAEPLRVHRDGNRQEREARAREMLEQVGLNASHAARRPGEMSGGQQQRVGIARALITHPKLVVLDEPVSALDVSIQAQVVNLLQDLQDELGAAYLFIAHDLAVVRHISDRVAVMYLGQVVEEAPADELFAEPRHPYTMGLVASVLTPEPGAAEQLVEAEVLASGDVPSLLDPPTGCRYHTRCPFVIDRCRAEAPVLEPAGGGAPGHRVACHRWEDIAVDVRRPQRPAAAKEVQP